MSKPGRAKHEGPGTHAGHVARRRRLPAEEIEHLAISHDGYRAHASAGHEEHVEVIRAVHESHVRHDIQARRITDRGPILPYDVHFRVHETGKHRMGAQ